MTAMAQEQEKRLGRPPKAAAPGQRVSLGLKVTADIKQRLDEEARRTGRTQSQQAELMIERSFTEQAALGGPDMQRLAYLMVTAFATAGQGSAAGKPDWINDRDAYRAGVIGVVDALMIGLPNSTPEDVDFIIKSLDARLRSRLFAETGHFKASFGEVSTRIGRVGERKDK
jgi:hypothetical protein